MSTYRLMALNLCQGFTATIGSGQLTHATYEYKLSSHNSCDGQLQGFGPGCVSSFLRMQQVGHDGLRQRAAFVENF